MSNTPAAIILAVALVVLIVSFGVSLSVYNYAEVGTTEKAPSSHILEEED